MRISDWSSDVCSSDLSKRPSKDINGKRKLRHMIPASARDDETESTNGERSESRLAALARNLVETVGVEGAIRYCSSLGWRRSDERRVGKEWVRTCRSRWSP